MQAGSTGAPRQHRVRGHCEKLGESPCTTLGRERTGGHTATTGCGQFSECLGLSQVLSSLLGTLKVAPGQAGGLPGSRVGRPPRCHLLLPGGPPAEAPWLHCCFPGTCLAKSCSVEGGTCVWMQVAVPSVAPRIPKLGQSCRLGGHLQWSGDIAERQAQRSPLALPGEGCFRPCPGELAQWGTPCAQ